MNRTPYSTELTETPYPSELTDAKWECLEPLLPKPKSGTRKAGRPATCGRSWTPSSTTCGAGRPGG